MPVYAVADETSIELLMITLRRVGARAAAISR
jgi:hypothetical protein